MVNVVNRLHNELSLPQDANGRCLYLEQYIYYVVREDISEACLSDTVSNTLSRKEWIRHTMNARDRKNTKDSRIIRHSSYSDSPHTPRINPSVSDPDLTPKV